MKEFSLKEKQDLLKSARGSIKKYLGLEDDSSSILEEGNLSLERGIFVTLHKQAGLRGCIGYIYPQGKLLSSVRKLALEAAFRDPRFLPLSREELSEVDIEISVLTVPKRVVSPYDINLGEDGVIIK
ncbi:MAG: AmmeMemoRadiSam system protein A, partial [Elusimicrobia bacterium]|nr:AmmeMemoRadiSam system protein A [Elusimicrobiota bacterium]